MADDSVLDVAPDDSAPPAPPPDALPEPEITDAATPEPDGDGEFFETLNKIATEKGVDFAALRKKFNDDPDALLGGLLESTKTVGKRNEDAAYVQRLRESGWSEKEIGEALTQYAEAQRQPKPNGKPEAAADDWEDDYIGFDENTKPFFTQAALAKHSKDELTRMLNQRVAEGHRWSLNPKKHVRKTFEELLPEIETRVEQRVSEALAKKEIALTQRMFAKQYAADLFVDGKPGGEPTPLLERLNHEFSELNPARFASYEDMLERAMEKAREAVTPKMKTPIPNPRGKRTPPAAVPKLKNAALETQAREIIARDDDTSLLDFLKFRKQLAESE